MIKYKNGPLTGKLVKLNAYGGTYGVVLDAITDVDESIKSYRILWFNNKMMILEYYDSSTSSFIRNYMKRPIKGFPNDAPLFSL